MRLVHVASQRRLLVELLEDRRVLSTLSLLPGAILTQDLLAPVNDIPVVQSVLPETNLQLTVEASLDQGVKLGVETTLNTNLLSDTSLNSTLATGLQLDAALSTTESLVLESAVNLDASLAPPLTPTIDLGTNLGVAVGVETVPSVGIDLDAGLEIGPGPDTPSIKVILDGGVVIQDGTTGIDLGTEVVIGPETGMDLGGEVIISEPGPLAPPDGLPPPSPGNEGTELPPPMELVGGFFLDGVNLATVGTTDFRIPNEGQRILDEPDLTRVVGDEDISDRAETGEEVGIMDGWRVVETEVEHPLEGVHFAGISGQIIPVALGLGLSAQEVIHQLETGNLSGPLALDLHNGNGDVSALQAALDAFLQDMLDGLAILGGWLARLGPLPWILMGTALTLSGLEAVSRFRRRHLEEEPLPPEIVKAGM